MSNRIFATGINILEKLQGIHFSAYISASSCLATQERSLRNKHRLWLVVKTRISAVNRWGFGRRGGKESRFEKLQKGQMLPLHMQLFQNKPMPHGALKNINNIVPAAFIISYPKFPSSSRSQLHREKRDTKVQLSVKINKMLLLGSLCAYQGGDHIKWEKATKGHSKHVAFRSCVAYGRYCSSRRHSLKNQYSSS